MEKEKRRLGDRKDGKLLRNLDPMHFIVPLLYPNRCDNEAYISVKVETEKINKWLEKQNETEADFKYTLFHVIVAAILKTIILRPKLNRFIANKNMYLRNEVTASFVVKKIFSDDGAEALAIINAKDDDTIFTLHDKLYKQVSSCRGDTLDASSESMDMFNKMPRFVSKTIIAFIRFLDRHGWCPQSLIASDPYYTSVVLSNLGSIKLKCGYHHLTNWGTNSLFCIIGEKKLSSIIDQDGSTRIVETVDLGLTIDERLADGYYYSKTIKLLKKILENPELLENSLNSEVDY